MRGLDLSDSDRQCNCEIVRSFWTKEQGVLRQRMRLMLKASCCFCYLLQTRLIHSQTRLIHLQTRLSAYLSGLHSVPDLVYNCSPQSTLQPTTTHFSATICSLLLYSLSPAHSCLEITVCYGAHCHKSATALASAISSVVVQASHSKIGWSSLYTSRGFRNPAG